MFGLVIDTGLSLDNTYQAAVEASGRVYERVIVDLSRTPGSAGKFLFSWNHANTRDTTNRQLVFVTPHDQDARELQRAGFRVFSALEQAEGYFLHPWLYGAEGCLSPRRQSNFYSLTLDRGEHELSHLLLLVQKGGVTGSAIVCLAHVRDMRPPMKQLLVQLRLALVDVGLLLVICEVDKARARELLLANFLVVSDRMEAEKLIAES